MKMHERIIELFEAEGLNAIFGIPDPSFFAMFLHAEARGWQVTAPHHEEAACFEAEAYYRYSGKPGIVIGNKGPGVANLASGAIHAAKENIPTIFIGGNRHRLYEQRARRGKMQYLSQEKLFENYVKWVGTIEYPSQVDEIVHEAIRRALDGVPGPVYIDYPANVLGAELDLPPAPPPSAYRLVHRHAGSESIAAAKELIAKASLPVLVVGNGAFSVRAHEKVAALAQALNAPILQTNGGLAVLEGLEDRTFGYGTTAGNDIAAKSDVVIAIGTELGEPLHYGRGRHWAKGHTDRKWIYVESDALAIGANRAIDVPLVGDLRDIVPQLTEAVAPLRRTPHPDLPSWTRTKNDEAAALFATAPQTLPIHPARLALEASKVLPRDAAIVRDGGASSMFFTSFLQFPPRDFIWNQNYGSIGPGLPYAVGAQIAVGRARRVVLLTGDSSFLFHISELETAVRKNLPIVCIVAVDHAWGIEVASYKAIFGADSRATEARWSRGVRLDRTAESFGAHGEYVEKIEDIAPAVQRALDSGKPAVVHVAVDPDAISHMAGLPGIGEFRTWFGEEGDNLGNPGASY